MRALVIVMLGSMAAGSALAQSAGITLADFQVKGRATLLEADRNGDGRLGRAEWTARRGSANQTLNPGTVFDRLDTNRDGVLDQAELDGLLARRFTRMDANADGRLSSVERKGKRGRVQD